MGREGPLRGGWGKAHQKYQDSLRRLLHALDPKSWPVVE
jgi:hypothetical protein